jgi:hypothetical protein
MKLDEEENVTVTFILDPSIEEYLTIGRALVDS